MFKLVVLSTFLAAAVADPEPSLLAAPAYIPGIISPAARILPASSYVYRSSLISAPLSYSTPLDYAHLIKKRSAPLELSPYSFHSSYIAPGSYAYSSPIVSSYSATAPLIPAIGSGLVYSSRAHFIKKRSAPLYSSAYIAPSSISPLSYATPFVASTYSAPVFSNPLISSAPFSYPTHLIKKRSSKVKSQKSKTKKILDLILMNPGLIIRQFDQSPRPISYDTPLSYPHPFYGLK